MTGERAAVTPVTRTVTLGWFRKYAKSQAVTPVTPVTPDFWVRMRASDRVRARCVRVCDKHLRLRGEFFARVRGEKSGVTGVTGVTTDASICNRFGFPVTLEVTPARDLRDRSPRGCT